MISEFQELSDKIDRLAELTASLRRENASLRQSNALLAADKLAYIGLLDVAQRRVAALLDNIPAEAGAPTDPDDEAAQ
jgi:cell division protein ZapB